jgi:hypothetical protein
MKYPNLINAEQFIEDTMDGFNGYNYVNVGERWYHARPLGYQSLWSRLYCTWLVFTGKADAIVWSGDQ